MHGIGLRWWRRCPVNFLPVHNHAPLRRLLQVWFLIPRAPMKSSRLRRFRLDKLRVLDLFSGIGGFSLGLERTGGFETVAFCEIEEFPRRVLAKHWPGVPIYHDVRELTKGVLDRDGIAVDVITGGFPCQDLSVAGKQRGMGEGTRSGLWSEIVRLIGELRPRYVIVENVANLLSGPSEKRGGWFGRVLGDLADCGYDAEWENIPASALGAPHRRARVWIVAYPNAAQRGQVGEACNRLAFRPDGLSQRQKGSGGPAGGCEHVADAAQLQCDGRDDHAGKCVEWGPLSELGNGGWAKHLAHAAGIGQQGPGEPFIACNQEACGEGKAVDAIPGRIGAEWRVEPDVGRVAHGVPDRAHRLAALGNAVVPQIPELIGRAILEAAE